MWVRAAYFEGKILPGQEEYFVQLMEKDIMPGIRSSPGVRRANIWWPRHYEDRPEAIFCQIVAEFDEEAGIAEMIASPERQAVRERLKQALPLFEGVISHINFEVPN